MGAAKKMRIKVHPDMLKRKKPGISMEEKIAIDEQAKTVGEAAEILSDPVKVCAPSSAQIMKLVVTIISTRNIIKIFVLGRQSMVEFRG